MNEIEFPCCPVCGAVLYETLYLDADDNIAGCSECVKEVDAAEYWEEQRENDKHAYEDMLYDQWKDAQCGL